MHTRASALLAGVFVVSLSSCGSRAPEAVTLQGDCADVFGGQICTWGTVSGGNVLTEFGLTVPLAAIEGAPVEMEMAWPPVPNAVLRMPAEVTAATGVDHFTFFWEAHGHPPGAYLTPHFDFHFYGVGIGAREAIDCTDASKPATPPAGYDLPDVDIPGLGMLTGLCVPAMGMHSAPASELASDVVFDGTMIIGYYGGSPIFFEPMIGRDYLLRRESFNLTMPVVTGLADGVRYPTQFRAEYDAAAEAYRFVFSGT